MTGKDEDFQSLDLHRFPGHLIRRLHQISVGHFTDKLAAHGIDLTPVQYAALRAVKSTPGIDQASVAGLIAYDRATLGKVIDRLESKGLIDRSISPKDRRARQLHLTKQGHSVLSAAHPLVEQVQGDILAGLDSEEKAQIMRLLQKAATAGNEHSRAPLRRPAQEGS